jgi:glycosyltransferase involved in cell wall biosynthesis
MTAPRVSILLPVRNEERHIEQTLRALVAQDYPRDRVEILVADGRSEDRTREIVEGLAREVPGLTLIDNPGRIVSTGLNAALSRARGAYLIRVDGHTEIAPDYVSQCVAELERTGADNAGGRMETRGETPFGRAVAVATSSPFGVGNARFHYATGEEWVDTVYLGAWPRRTFERVGGFDEELVRNQDDEHNARLRAAGGRILLSPKIRSVYTVRSGPLALWRQYFSYGFWKVRVLQKRARQMKPRHFAPPLAVLTVAAGAALAPFLPAARWGLLALAAADGAANHAGSLPAGRGLPPSVRVRLPFAFAILHFAYGIGFLGGLLRFAGRFRGSRAAAPSIPEVTR